jgi:hypothetical protein
VIEHWNGASWAVQRDAIPVGSAFSGLSSVSCSSARECTAVGADDGTTAAGEPRVVGERWNGQRWSLQKMPMPPDDGGYGYVTLNGAACPSRSVCVAVGSDVISQFCSWSPYTNAVAEAWNGRKWRLASVDSSRSASDTWLDSVSCSSSTSCLAIGGYDFGDGCDYGGPCTTKPLVERWNGVRWGVDQGPQPESAKAIALAGVSCVRLICTVVGSVRPSRDGALFAAQTAGAGWSITSLPEPRAVPLCQRPARRSPSRNQ